ncbi:MAG: hypothetical protein ABIS67_00970 [Candidatus Eisenbacteria bacterium]
MKADGRSIRKISLLVLIVLTLGGPGVDSPAAETDSTSGAVAIAAQAGTLAGAGTSAAGGTDGLKASTGIPWNPSGPLSRRRAWEQVVLLPGRIVTLPLSGLGYLTDQTLGFVEGTALLAKVSGAARVVPERFGVNIKPAQLGARTGLGATLGLRTPFLGGTFKNRIRADFSMTTRQYNRTLVTIQGRPAQLQYGYDWRPEERFYGVGIATPEDSAAAYASQSEFMRVAARWAWNRDTENAPPRTEVNMWGGPRTTVTRTGREDGTASFGDRFPGLAASTLNYRVEHLIYGGSFSTDWRAGKERWSRGWRVRVQGERYDRPNKLTALRIGRSRGAQFTRLVYETETGFSFRRDPRTLRFLVRVMDQSISSAGDRFLLSDMAKLGGRDGLAGFEAGRFHDLDLLLTKVSYIFPIVRRLEFDLHSEWGGVYSNVWGDPRLSTLKNSYGFALRGRNKDGPIGAIGMDFSREAARVRFSLGGLE